MRQPVANVKLKSIIALSLIAMETEKNSPSLYFAPCQNQIVALEHKCIHVHNNCCVLVATVGIFSSSKADRCRRDRLNAMQHKHCRFFLRLIAVYHYGLQFAMHQIIPNGNMDVCFETKQLYMKDMHPQESPGRKPTNAQ